jgi:hypothetical protein
MLWARMLAYVTGTVNQELLLRNEYRSESFWSFPIGFSWSISWPRARSFTARCCVKKNISEGITAGDIRNTAVQ